jgi:hypothetical protein
MTATTSIEAAGCFAPHTRASYLSLIRSDNVGSRGMAQRRWTKKPVVRQYRSFLKGINRHFDCLNGTSAAGVVEAKPPFDTTNFHAAVKNARGEFGGVDWRIAEASSHQHPEYRDLKSHRTLFQRGRLGPRRGASACARFTCRALLRSIAYSVLKAGPRRSSVFSTPR